MNAPDPVNRPVDSHVNSHVNSRVPTGITIGLLLFSIVLSLGSFIPLPAQDRPWSLVALVFSVHVLLIPLGFVLGGWLTRKINGDAIDWRNSLSLGLLISCVWMLWKMGAGE